jgi:hypothetical protein
MPAKTYYFLTTTAATPNWFGSLQDGGSAPTAASTAFGWAPSKTAISTPYYKAFIGATGTSSAASASNYLTTSPGNTGPQKGTGSGATTAGDSFVIPAALTGSFASGTWTLNINLRASTAGCVGRIHCSVWRSVNASGASATSVISDQVGATVTLSTTADVNSSITFNPGVVNLNNEYLFFQMQFEETTLGTTTNDNVLFRVGLGSNSVNCAITTPVFSVSISRSIGSPQTVTINKDTPKVIAWSDTTWNIVASFPSSQFVLQLLILMGVVSLF